MQAHPEVGTPDGCGSPLPGRTMPPAPRPRVRAARVAGLLYGHKGGQSFAEFATYHLADFSIDSVVFRSVEHCFQYQKAIFVSEHDAANAAAARHLATESPTVRRFR